FKRLELEWIDLPAASVDGVLCRWGVMLVLDPEAAMREMRRVLRPGGRVALAVWGSAEHNPWATVPTRALIELGHATPPDPTAPGMFRLADRDMLAGMLADAGFTEVKVEAVDVARDHESVDDFVAVQLDLSQAFSGARAALPDDQWAEVVAKIAALAEPYVRDGGGLHFPGRSLAAVAHA
ncbi:MAG: methyltransferase domain-containing protein, partial [Actinomycetota bacterium]|nr:methyltransferase domain-containing protein [Actinomycetota bacterium]